MAEFIPITIKQFQKKMFPEISLFEIGEIMLQQYYDQYLKLKLPIDVYVFEMGINT